MLNESGDVVDEPRLVRTARHALDALGVSPLAELSVRLVDTVEMERLHTQHMGEPGPTDVLSFAMDEYDLRGSRGVTHSQGRAWGAPDEQGMPGMLGDVVLCPDVAAQQARTAEHATADELDLLCVHGLLHLLGFDHAEPEEHAQMFALQTELLAGREQAPSEPS